MPNTFTQLLIQLVFAVKGRQNFVKESFRDELEKYICGIARNKSHKPLSIYCMPDHLHFLVGLHTSQSISELVKVIKKSSTDFINERHFLKNHFYWQEGFGASVIPNHKWIKETFQQEYLNFLKKFEIMICELLTSLILTRRREKDL